LEAASLICAQPNVERTVDNERIICGCNPLFAPFDEVVQLSFLEGDKVVRRIVNREHGLFAGHELCNVRCACRIEAADAMFSQRVIPNLSCFQPDIFEQAIAQFGVFVESGDG